MTVDYCNIWTEEPSFRETVIWILLACFPLAIGPFATLLVEFILYMKTIMFKTNDDRYYQRKSCTIVLLLAIVVFLCYSINLLLAEKYLKQFLQLSHFSCLLLKYFLGSLHLVVTPVIVCLLDTKIRKGIGFLYRRRRKRPGTGNLR